MRLFVGLPPSPAARDELAGALDPHRACLPGLRWLDPAGWHLTLSFLGEVPDRALPGLLAGLAGAAASHAPMTLSLTGAGAFPSAGRARVFWAGLGGDHVRLARLADDLGDAARRAGVDRMDHRPFRPHVSLARCAADTDMSHLVETFASFSGIPWEARTVHLVWSRPVTGVRYETVAEWPLTARAPRGQS